MGHFVSSPRERANRDRRDSRREEREGQRRKVENESEETEVCKDSRPCPSASQYQMDTLVMQDTQHLCLFYPHPFLQFERVPV